MQAPFLNVLHFESLVWTLVMPWLAVLCRALTISPVELYRDNDSGEAEWSELLCSGRRFFCLFVCLFGPSVYFDRHHESRGAVVLAVIRNSPLTA